MAKLDLPTALSPGCSVCVRLWCGGAARWRRCERSAALQGRRTERTIRVMLKTKSSRWVSGLQREGGAVAMTTPSMSILLSQEASRLEIAWHTNSPGDFRPLIGSLGSLGARGRAAGSPWRGRWSGCPPSPSTASSATPSSACKRKGFVTSRFSNLNPTPARSSPVALLHQVAFLLAAELLVPLQLVHAVAALLALRVLRRHMHPLRTDSSRRATFAKTCNWHKHGKATQTPGRYATGRALQRPHQELYGQHQHAPHAAALTLLDLIPDKQKAEGGDRGKRCETSEPGECYLTKWCVLCLQRHPCMRWSECVTDGELEVCGSGSQRRCSWEAGARGRVPWKRISLKLLAFLSLSERTAGICVPPSGPAGGRTWSGLAGRSAASSPHPESVWSGRSQTKSREMFFKIKLLYYCSFFIQTHKLETTFTKKLMLKLWY